MAELHSLHWSHVETARRAAEGVHVDNALLTALLFKLGWTLQYGPTIVFVRHKHEIEIRGGVAQFRCSCGSPHEMYYPDAYQALIELDAEETAVRG